MYYQYLKLHCPVVPGNIPKGAVGIIEYNADSSCGHIYNLIDYDHKLSKKLADECGLLYIGRGE